MPRHTEGPKLTDSQLAQKVGAKLTPAEEDKLKDDEKRLRWASGQIDKVLTHLESLNDRRLQAGLETGLHYLQEQMEDAASEKVKEVRDSRLNSIGTNNERLEARTGGRPRAGRLK